MKLGLIKGVNSYLDITEADNIIESELFDNSEEYSYWNNLSTRNKETLIRRSTKLVDKSLFRGRKVEADNPLSFPRIIDGVEVECPYDIKVAILLNGLRNAVNNGKDEIVLQQLGVKSYSIEGSSISFNNKQPLKTSYGVYRDIQETYIENWVY